MAMSSAFISGIGTSNDAAKYPAKPTIAILKIYASTILSAGLSWFCLLSSIFTIVYPGKKKHNKIEDVNRII